MGAAPDCGGPRHALIPAAADEVEDDDGAHASMGGGGDPNWWPPGFRFHPTDEELVLYYLKRKVCGRRIKLSMIGDVDVYKWEPWELPDKSLLRSRDKQWYYFSPRDRKYPNGSRSNRATKHGYWKATGKDRTISHNSKAAGNKKTLVYYHGRAPKGERTDWVMHEYTLDEKVLALCSSVQDYFALYKLFRKSGPGPKNGEQYGAPFREEEWEEDVPGDSFMNHTNVGYQSNEHLQIQSVDRVSNVVGERSLNYDIENMLLQMPNEPDVVPQHAECYSLNDDARVDNLGSRTDICIQTTEHIQNHSVSRIVNEDTNTLPNFDLEDILLQMPNELDVVPEANITVNPLSYQDDLFIQQTYAECEHGSVMTSFQNTSAAANVQPIEMTSLTGSSVQGQDIADEEFLEIKDLNDLDSLNWVTEEISNNDHIAVSGGLIDADDYFDAQMFLAEATGPGHVINQYSCWDDFGDNGRHSQASHLTTEVWTQVQSHNASTAVVASSASSGLVYANDSQPDDGLTLGEMNNVGTPSESWFNSALLAFLDSVPSSPALASENTLISRALQRVSSFRTGQTQEAGELPATKGSISSTINSRGSNRNGGFLFISFLVGVGAIFWVLTIGTALKLIKGFWGRFVSS